MNKRQGFTLIELSIVLVIIGLIVGGVLMGQDLIHAAKVRNVMSEANEYKTAYNTFKLKYNAFPGDMADATEYWGAADGDNGTGNDCVLLTTKNPLTCNGNGDETMHYSVESFLAWEHLALAGLIPGSYYGEREAPDYYIPEGNAPTSALGGQTVYQFHTNTVYTRTNIHQLKLAGAYSGVLQPVGSAINSKDAYDIDVKMDDGRPSSGRVFAGNGYTGTYPRNCTSGWRIDLDAYGVAEYANFDNVIAGGCVMVWMLD